MHVKPLSQQHLFQVSKIHEKYFKDEFPLSDVFDNKILNQFVVTDDDDNVITYGGIKLLFELFLVTDLDKSPRTRVEALKTFLNKAISEGQKKEFEQLHCFATHDWVNILEKVGFSKTKGPALYINL